ncbi:hypothetical protein KY289_031723 [Solanum tuberosum]|nr:hypothetical protein KY289_031723 [Solanum tuberosum]
MGKEMFTLHGELRPTSSSLEVLSTTSGTKKNIIPSSLSFVDESGVMQKKFLIITNKAPLTIKAYPRTTAVLVCNHGIYIWGDSCISAKTQELTGQCQLMLPFRMQKQVHLLKWQHKAIKVLSNA